MYKAHKAFVGNRLWLFSVLAMTVAIAATPLVALAEQAAGGAEERVSMFSGSVWNAIWAWSIFLLLLIVLGKFAWGPVVKLLEEREQKVAATIADAERGRDEAMVLLGQYQRKLDQVQLEAGKMVEQAQAEAARIKDQFITEAKQEADHARQRAVQQIEISKNEAVAAIFAEAAGLATSAAGSILQRELRPEDQQRLVEQALNEMKRTDSPGASR